MAMQEGIDPQDATHPHLSSTTQTVKGKQYQEYIKETKRLDVVSYR